MAEISGTYDTSRFGEKVLRIDNVVKRFGDNTVLDHISFDVHKHETVALLGPSGSSTCSSRSTTARSGSARPTSPTRARTRMPSARASASCSSSSTSSPT